MAQFDIVDGGVVNPGFNTQFKRQKTAGIPKSNFLVWAIPSVAGVPDLANPKLIAGCQNLSGLEARVEEKESNNSENLNTAKTAGKVTHTNITLTRGVDHNNFIRQWFLQRGNSGVGSNSGISDRFICDLVIGKLGADSVTIERLILVKNAWVVMYKADDFDVNSTDPLFESIEITHEGWAYGIWQALVNSQDTAGNRTTFTDLGNLENSVGTVLIAPATADYYYHVVAGADAYTIVDAAEFFIPGT